MPLSTTTQGSLVTVTGFNAGQGLESRCISLGIVSGTQIEVIRNSGSGPFLIAVKGSRFMIGRSMAQKIMVR